MSPLEWISNYIAALFRPSLLLGMGVYHFTMTTLEIIFLDRRPLRLFDITALRFRSFARLWKNAGASMSIEMPGPIDTLLQQCSGLVLDIGPGSGEILPRFNPAKITAIYGAEPAVELHPGLIQNAEKAGFGGKYHALLCGGEPESLIPALDKSGLLKEGGEAIFDEICCVRVLCGVPRPRETIKGLYSLLKPGGRMVICEHVVNPWRTEGRVLGRIMQLAYTLAGWPFFMGGCELQRHTPEYLREAGEWEKFDLEYVGAKDAIPFVVGELIKKSGS